MPKIAVYKFLTFFIYMFDTLKEPPHLHVIKNKIGRTQAAKIWLNSLEFAETGNFTETELNLVYRVVLANQDVLLQSFEQARQGKKIKTINLNRS